MKDEDALVILQQLKAKVQATYTTDQKSNKRSLGEHKIQNYEKILPTPNF